MICGAFLNNLAQPLYFLGNVADGILHSTD
jgi:hypothetical protein